MTHETRRVLHSSDRQDWRTPMGFFKELDAQYGFTCDVCASADNALVRYFCDDVAAGMLKDTDTGCMMVLDWKKEIFFCNPPYGRRLHAIVQCIPDDARGVMLLPSRTGSLWWQTLVLRAQWVLFIRGRLRFEQALYPAPFDSVLLGFHVPAVQHIDGVFLRLKQEDI